MKFENKIVLITGAAHGMGKNHAKAFINEGASVIITDINEELGKQTAEELGENALFIKHDVAEETDWINVVSIVKEKYGKLDVLVNNAGVMPFGPLGVMSFDDYKKYIGINQFSVFLSLTHCAELLKASGNASVINVSSTAGLRAMPYGAAYNSSKFAVRALTKVAALEWAKLGIRVNTLCPGPTMTKDVDLNQSASHGDGGSVAAFLQTLPMGRFGTMDELTKMVLFLASDDSSFCTGADFVADGGITENK